MKYFFSFVFLFYLISVLHSHPYGVDTNCIITNFTQVQTVVNSCRNILISSLTVPGGQQLLLELKEGTTLTFEGVTKFEVAHWQGHLIAVKGNNVTVQGAPGSILDAQGEKYWDGQGGAGGVTKPKFFYVQTTGGSVFKNIYLLNCAHFCVGVGAKDTTITGWTIDSVAGDKDLIALNTDGFGVSSHSDNILIENSVIMNQDDCVVVNQGTNMVFRNLHCYGSHGLSFAVGFGGRDKPEDDSVASNITFENCWVSNGLYGIHVKTGAVGNKGRIENVVFRNIKLSGIQEDGIYIQQDYGNIGNLESEVKIYNLTVENVTGSVQGVLTRPIHVFCGNRSTCYDWKFSDINILGGGKSYCNYEPDEFHC
ncbi:polygalacturonase-like [Diabrotica undecimpunctata]|uniref:polygalacturonase-like n=1 Tax=Diabrotica undecimpunctata TaxID=50387 RepID=UPI003B63A464